jgi:ABC-2 type transport system permease protein
MPKIFTSQSLLNIWLIAKREYLERIRTKAFLIATIMIPALMGGLGFGSAWIGSHTKSSAHIAILSTDPVFARDLKQELEHGKDSHMTVDLLPNTPAERTQLDRQLRNTQSPLAGYLQVLAAGPPPNPPPS